MYDLREQHCLILIEKLQHATDNAIRCRVKLPPGYYHKNTRTHQNIYFLFYAITSDVIVKSKVDRDCFKRAGPSPEFQI